MSNILRSEFVRLSTMVLGLLFPVSGTLCQTRAWQANVAPDRLTLLSEPSAQGRALATLSLGENVGILLKLRIHDEDWCKVRVLATLSVGYVQCDALKPGKSVASNQTSPERVSPIVASASSAPVASTTTSTSHPAPLAIDPNAALTNKDVLELNKVGLSADALVLKIKSSSCSFDTSPTALQELKLQHVPDAVILAMLQAPKLLLKTAVTTAPEIAAKPSPVAHEPIANGTIAAGSKVFIEPMDGFESFLAAALEKKKVPLVVVSDPQLAEFTIGGNSDSKKAGWAKIVFMGNLHSDEEASITMVNAKTHAVVFAYAVNKKNTLHGEQTSAEACAKHLKQKMEGHD